MGSGSAIITKNRPSKYFELQIETKLFRSGGLPIMHCQTNTISFEQRQVSSLISKRGSQVFYTRKLK